MIKTVLFDLDGTLIDTLQDLMDSVNFVLRANNFPERSYEEIRRFVGSGIPKLIKRALPENVNEDVTELCVSQMYDYYSRNCKNKTAPYDGIMELLDELKSRGILTAVITNKAHLEAAKLSNELFEDRIDLIIGAKDNLPLKPAPDGIYEALKILETEKENSIFVGDSEVDIRTANNAKVNVVGVLWGFRDKKALEKEGAKNFISVPMELLNHIM